MMTMTKMVTHPDDGSCSDSGRNFEFWNTAVSSAVANCYQITIVNKLGVAQKYQDKSSQEIVAHFESVDNGNNNYDSSWKSKLKRTHRRLQLRWGTVNQFFF